jgi:hypothetical protein
MNSVDACFTSGRSALEPEAVTVPVIASAGAGVALAVAGAVVAGAEAFGEAEAAVLLSVLAQPATTPINRIAEIAKMIPFFDMNFDIVSMSSFVFIILSYLNKSL